MICEWPEGARSPKAPVPYSRELMTGFEHHVDRVSDMLFKLAVSIEKQNLIASGEYDDYYESYIEEVAIENVQKRHGRL